MEELYSVEIQNEYKKIDYKWLNLHYKTTVGLVIFSLFVECVLGVIMCNSDELHTTIPIFILKFIIIPFVINMCCILIDYMVMHSKKLSQNIKVYIVSLVFIVICFMLFTAHIAFSALYFIFALPIMLTTIYVDYKLTTIASILSMASICISELFIKWDIDKVSIMKNANRLGDFIISLFSLLAFSAVCMVVIYFEREKNCASIQKEMEKYQLQQRLKLDEQTGIYNRIALRNELNDMEADKSENSYIFAMIDIDNFKEINDNLGHLVGDHCLLEFGKILTDNCSDATPFRFGGDEFCILFRNHTVESVIATCKKIQSDFKEINVKENKELMLTASIGIAIYTKGISTSKLITNTDKALYEAKTVRNAIRIHKVPKNVTSFI